MRKPNRYGCIPCEDVCLKHDEPLICKHGCSLVGGHFCKNSEPTPIDECPICHKKMSVVGNTTMHYECLECGKE